MLVDRKPLKASEDNAEYYYIRFYTSKYFHNSGTLTQDDYSENQHSHPKILWTLLSLVLFCLNL